MTTFKTLKTIATRSQNTLLQDAAGAVSYTHLTLPTTPYV